jgi:pyruvate dehydrogenase E1 component alpha subunit
MPIENIADRAVAFGIPGKIVDGNDVMAVHEAAQQAIQRARDGLGPSLMECKTCRIRRMQETRGPEHCLPEEIIEEWKKRDPVKIMKERMIEAGALTEDSFFDIKKQLQDRVDKAFDLARGGKYASPEEVFKDVYAEGGDMQ